MKFTILLIKLVITCFSVFIESHSALKSYEMLEESVKIMSGKCDTLLSEIEKHLETDMEA